MNVKHLSILLATAVIGGCAYHPTEIYVGHKTVALRRSVEINAYSTNDLFSMPPFLKERGASLTTNGYFEVFETGTAVEITNCVQSPMVASIIPHIRGYSYFVNGMIFSTRLGTRIPIRYSLNNRLHELDRAPWEGTELPQERSATRENVLAAICSWNCSGANSSNQVEIDHDP